MEILISYKKVRPHKRRTKKCPLIVATQSRPITE